VLSDPGWVVPPLAADDGGGMDRFRRAVSRFSTGEAHAERRAAVERALAAVPPAGLRTAARALTLGDPTPPVVPRVPLIALATALGIEDPAAVASLVPPVAAAYLPAAPLPAAPLPAAPVPAAPVPAAPPDRTSTRPAAAGPAAAGPAAGGPAVRTADEAADELVGRVGVVSATLLVQACLPVAALVTGALESGLDEVLSGDHPPVPATRRWSPDTGETVTVPLAGIPFGEGPRRCPAEQHARALAAGILDALRPTAPARGPGDLDGRAGLGRGADRQ
jgi:hypothetical protein